MKGRLKGLHPVTDRLFLRPGREVRDIQAEAYRTGRALKAHTDTVHGGKVDSSCPGCQELLAKAEKGNA